MRRTLLSSFVVVVMLGLSAPALAAETIDWTETPPESGSRVGSEVEIIGPGTFRLVTLEDPDVAGDYYEVSGTVRYAGVEGAAYLEMWSFFADGGAYFARTLAEGGPMASISGEDTGRDFVLPFSLNGSADPVRIEVNMVLPGKGTVWVGALTIDGLTDSSVWWSERTASLIGASAGVVAGISGAAIGLLGGRRRARRVVEGLLIAGLAVGAISLVVAGIAALATQPRHVWYPFALIGLILVVVDGALLPTTRRAYATAELHRMRALDAK